MARTIREIECMVEAMKECQRLDEAAGEGRPTLTISQWINRRMRDAVTRSRQPGAHDGTE